MPTYGSRFDVGPDGLGEQTMRVAQAAAYKVAVAHYYRRIGGGTIKCETLKSESGPGMRIVQLVADYIAADGIPTQRVVVCRSIEEEAAQLERLQLIIEAARRGRTVPQAGPGGR